MLIEDILPIHCVKANVNCLSRKKIIEFISEVAAERLNTDFQWLFDSLFAREKLGSTALGNQVAIPHCVNLSNKNEYLGIMVTLQSPVDYGAFDNLPVDVFFALIYPHSKAGSRYSEYLQKIAEILSDKANLKLIRNAATDQDLREVMIGLCDFTSVDEKD